MLRILVIKELSIEKKKDQLFFQTLFNNKNINLYSDNTIMIFLLKFIIGLIHN
jgi:hypothetical protein